MPFLTLNPAAALLSDHDKILLADGRRTLIGGRNIAGEYFGSLQDDPRAFRDTDLLLSGPPSPPPPVPPSRPNTPAAKRTRWNGKISI